MIKVQQTVLFKKLCAFTSDFHENFHFNKYIQGNIFKQKEILFFIIYNYFMEIYFLGTVTERSFVLYSQMIQQQNKNAFKIINMWLKKILCERTYAEQTCDNYLICIIICFLWNKLLLEFFIFLVNNKSVNI